MSNINVYFDSNNDWTEYTRDELKDYFRFTDEVHPNLINEIMVHDVSGNPWLEIIYNNEGRRIYNKTFGTYVRA